MSFRNSKARPVLLVLAVAAVLSAGGCGGLSDRQLSSIWQSALSTGLTTAVSNFIGLLIPAPQTAG